MTAKVIMFHIYHYSPQKGTVIMGFYINGAY